MEQCEYYHEDVVLYAKMPCRYKTLYRCYATKDCEGCTCCGDKSRCDFYPEVRKEAKKMNTLEMMNEAEKTGRTYTSGEIGSSDMMYNAEQGFHDIYGKPWDGYAFKYLNDLFASDIEWQVIPETIMTKSEAEAKFNIKIVG